MVVAGRVLDDGDVAIMMVEAESTPHTLRLVARSSDRPQPSRPWRKGWRPPSRSSRCCARAQQTVAEAAGKQPGEYPIFIDYQDDTYAAVERSDP